MGKKETGVDRRREGRDRKDEKLRERRKQEQIGRDWKERKRRETEARDRQKVRESLVR